MVWWVYLALAGGPVSHWVLEQVQRISPQVAGLLAPLISSQVVVLVVWIIVALATCQPIWRQVWRFPIIGNRLSKLIFPDLNGEWQVALESNWPIIDEMRQAAKDGKHTRFDVLNEREAIPNLQRIELRAVIEQNWFRTRVRISGGDGTPIQESTTVLVELIRSNETEGKRVAWIFKQTNRQPRLATDEQEFLGAAIMSVSDDGRSMKGKYWNNRSWDRGLNAAGLVSSSKLTS